jgi:hypothetical protein
MFAPAYMGRKRFFQMLSLNTQRFLLLAAAPLICSVGLLLTCSRNYTLALDQAQ